MKKVLKGNHAVAEGARLCRVQVVSAYPITPQTTVVEKLAEMCADGRLKAAYIRAESEHSVLASLLGASTAGARCFTATSSQGLLYMCEPIHWAAGARLPIVMAAVNRAVGSPWCIGTDQLDSLSQRDSGWIQIYGESSQEALDNVIMAFYLAEKTSLPAMITYDGFYLSHTSEVVDVPDQDQVDAFLPPYDPPFRMDLADPRMFGGITTSAHYYEMRYNTHRAGLTVLDLFPEASQRFFEIFGRSQDLVETYRAEDADLIVSCAGTLSSVARLAVDRARDRGIRAGLVKIRVFRPLPAAAWQQAFATAKKVAVVDRNLSCSMGGIFASEIKFRAAGGVRRPPGFFRGGRAGGPGRDPRRHGGNHSRGPGSGNAGAPAPVLGSETMINGMPNNIKHCHFRIL